MLKQNIFGVCTIHSDTKRSVLKVRRDPLLCSTNDTKLIGDPLQQDFTIDSVERCRDRALPTEQPFGYLKHGRNRYGHMPGLFQCCVEPCMQIAWAQQDHRRQCESVTERRHIFQ